MGQTIITYKNYKIDADDSSYDVSKTIKSEKHGERDVFLGCFSKIENAVREIAEDTARNSKREMELKEFVDELKQAKNEIMTMLAAPPPPSPSLKKKGTKK